MATVLITGGAGFIGSHLSHACIGRGDRVRVLDDLSTGRLENLEGLGERLEFIRGDIRDRATVDAAMVGVDQVLHQAALPSVIRSVEDPAASHDVNVNGMFNILESARAASVRRLVYAASSSAYGETPVLPKVETMAPKPLSPYGVAKLMGEYSCSVWHHVYGLECVALRYFNVFGPRQAPDSDYAAVIPLFIDLIRRGTSPTIHGDGQQTRDFCYIDNVVEANLKALSSPNAPGGVYNVACGQRYSLLDLVDAINDAMGTQVEAVHGPPRAGDIRDSLADIGAARRDLDYSAAVDFREGLARTIAWFTDVRT